MTCPQGHPVAADDRFCMECGAQVVTAVEAPPERKEGLWADRQPLFIASSGALLMLSSALPWFTSDDPGRGATYQNAFRVDGTWTNGVVLLVLAAVAFTVGIGTLLRWPAPVARWTAISIGAAALALAIRDGIEISDRVATVGVGESVAFVGSGIYVMGVAGVLAIIGALMRPPRLSGPPAAGDQ